MQQATLLLWLTGTAVLGWVTSTPPDGTRDVG